MTGDEQSHEASHEARDNGPRSPTNATAAEELPEAEDDNDSDLPRPSAINSSLPLTVNWLPATFRLESSFSSDIDIDAARSTPHNLQIATAVKAAKSTLEQINVVVEEIKHIDLVSLDAVIAHARKSFATLPLPRNEDIDINLDPDELSTFANAEATLNDVDMETSPHDAESTTASTELRSTATDAVDTPFPSVTGEKMIARLRQAIDAKWGAEILRAFDAFCQNLTARPINDAVRVQARLDQLHQDFQKLEAELWQKNGIDSKSPKYLQRPSGNPRALLLMMMHYPTFHKRSEKFFDPFNACVLHLMKKGINECTAFGLDMHSRCEASSTFSSRHCPGTDYPADVAKAHDDLAFAIIDVVDAPLSIFVGECPFKSNVRRLNSEVITVDVPIYDGRPVSFALRVTRCETSPPEISNLANKCPHTEALFKSTSDEGPMYAALMDSATNAMLHLASEEHDVNYFARLWKDSISQLASKSNVAGNYPLYDLYAIERREHEQGVVLTAAEYPEHLLGWAQNKFPTVDIDGVESKGMSIASAFVVARDNKVSKTRNDKAPEGGPGSGSKSLAQPSSSDEVHQWWHGREVRLESHSKGKTLRLDVGSSNVDFERVQTPLNTGLFRDIDAVSVYFLSDRLQLRRIDADRRPIWERMYADLATFVYGLDFVLHCRDELVRRLALREYLATNNQQ